MNKLSVKFQLNVAHTLGMEWWVYLENILKSRVLEGVSRGGMVARLQIEKCRLPALIRHQRHTAFGGKTLRISHV